MRPGPLQGHCQLGLGSRWTQGPAFSFLLPLSPVVENKVFSFGGSGASLVFLRSRCCFSFSSNHSLGDSLYRKSL